MVLNLFLALCVVTAMFLYYLFIADKDEKDNGEEMKK